MERLRLVVTAVVCAALGVVPSARALDPSRLVHDYVRDVWRQADGLPQMSVSGMVQSRDGYLWIATLDGVARFDGVRFETLNLIESAGTESNVVLAIAEGPDGAMWFGTRSGVVRLQDDRFRVFTKRQGLTDEVVRSLAVAPRGDVLVGTRHGGLDRISPDGRVTSLTTADGLAVNDVRAVLVEPDGTVWAGTSAGLSRVRGNAVEPVPIGRGGNERVILSLCRDRDGVIWAGTANGLWPVSPGARPSVGAQALPGRAVRAVLQDPEGNLWAGTTEDLVRVNAQGMQSATAPYGLSHSHVRSLLVDREGSLWIGTDGGGLNRYRDASVVMWNWRVSTVTDSLMSVYQDASGAMWMGANCGGLVRRDSHGTRIFTTKDGLAGECIRAIAGAPDGSLWASSTAGVSKLGRDGRVTRLTKADGLSGGDVMAIVVDRAGIVWLGTSGTGLDRYGVGKPVNLSTADGLPSDDVRALLEGRDGSLWIGTMGGGLARLREGRITVYGRREGLSSNYVLSLLEDPDGTLWIGTNGGGLTRMRDGVFTRVTRADGLYDDLVFQILDDGEGNLWMGCNRGIFRVSRREVDELARGTRKAVTCLALSRPDGLRTDGVMGGAQPSGWRASDGRLWFATVDGVAIVDPSKLTRNTVPPQVNVGPVRADGRVWPKGHDVTLPAGTGDIEIDYMAASFVAPSRMQFEYKLEGHDRDWVSVGTRRTAYFNNLGPGSYRLVVRASNSDGVWNRDGAALAFRVRPHVYETTTFFLAVATCVIGLVWGGFRLRLRQLRRHQQELAREVERATAELRVLKGLLPICASCKRIRDERGDWSQIESYIHAHSDANFTHDICPDCLQKLYPEYADQQDAAR